MGGGAAGALGGAGAAAAKAESGLEKLNRGLDVDWIHGDGRTLQPIEDESVYAEAVRAASGK